MLDGLTKRPKSLLSKYFYDTHGSELFERITQTPEYYLTRREAALLHANAKEIMHGLGTRAAIVEFGVEVTTRLCERLLREGAPGLHFYTMNQSEATMAVCANLGLPAGGGPVNTAHD